MVTTAPSRALQVQVNQVNKAGSHHAPTLDVLDGYTISATGIGSEASIGVGGGAGGTSILTSSTLPLRSAEDDLNGTAGIVCASSSSSCSTMTTRLTCPLGEVLSEGRSGTRQGFDCISV